jgi:deoxyribonuclease-4
MDQCEALGIESLVTHPGSHLGAGVEVGIQATVQSLNEVLAATAGYQTKIVIENTAGQGACIGHDFQQLKEIVGSVANPERIFFCFDTQHAFAAGYDLREQENYEEVFEHFNEVIGLKKIVAFHLNDAVKGLNSRLDRHENIGKGELGKIPFQLLVNDKRFKDTPMCLETFPGDDDENYRREIKLLKKFRK